jgi:hypothetical protein
MENQFLKKSYITEIISQLSEHGLKVSGKYGKLYCNEKGRWIYKQERMYLKSSSLRFLGQGIGTMRRSFRTLSVEEPSPEKEPVAASPTRSEKQKYIRRFSTTDARVLSGEGSAVPQDTPPPSPPEPSTVALSRSAIASASAPVLSLPLPVSRLSPPLPPPLPLPSPPPRRKSGYFHSFSARTVLTLSDDSSSANAVPFDQLYSPRDEVPSGANLPLHEQSEIIFESLWEEVLPSMIVYELFLQLGAAWLGDGSSTSVAASQRRLLQKVNSRTAILNTTTLIDQMKLDRGGGGLQGVAAASASAMNLTGGTFPSGGWGSSGGVGVERGANSPRGQLSRTPSNTSLVNSDDFKNVRTIDTDLLNELLNDIEENAMIHMPDLVDPTPSPPLDQQTAQQTAEGEEVRTRPKSSSSYPPIPSLALPLSSPRRGSTSSSHHPSHASIAVKELNRQESLGSELPFSTPPPPHTSSSTPRNLSETKLSHSSYDHLKDRDRGSDRDRDSSSHSTPRDRDRVGTGKSHSDNGGGGEDGSGGGAAIGSGEDNNSQISKSLRFAPSVPLKRPSWNSPTTPLNLARKRRPGMVVRLALSQNGPFQKLLTEGVRVVLHCLYSGETRPRRLQRIMMLHHDGRRPPWHQPTDDDSYDLNDYISSDSPAPTSHKTLKLKFHRFESGLLVETSDEIVVTTVSEILTGVHTTVFKRSLNQLYGEGSSYEKSGTEKRCFTMVGCVSPYDGRHCLDIEIQPVDKQKPEASLPSLSPLVPSSHCRRSSKPPR